jgi:ribonucleoside-triphosphate reductase
MGKGKQFISDLKLYTDYLKFKDDLGRFERWDEAVDEVLDTHIMRYGEVARPLINEVRPSYLNLELLASQRNLQFRGDRILKNNAKLYNCCTTYAYSPDVFHRGFHVLLSGTGLGVSLKREFTRLLPSIHKRTKGAKIFVVQDSIDGWADAAKALLSSYIKHPSLWEEYYGYEIKFDYSLVREKGAFITGGFKAPGPDGLKLAMERIEKLLNDHLTSMGGGKRSAPITGLIAYEIFMHLSDAVLSGGVRRSAMNIIMDADDYDLINAKTGNWRQTHPWRARSNNSVGLIRDGFTKKQFNELVSKNEGDNDLGFVFMSHFADMFNPCFEIGFNFWEQIKNREETVFQFCNLNEISASACVDSKGNFSKEKFYELCRRASILGTLQAGYTSFPYLGKQTEEIVAGEALLGISITGWMSRPELFNPEILKEGARIVKETNKEVAAILGINQAARTTTVKPSGNASVILQTSSGIHPEHSEKYFRVMQLNKESETAEWLLKNRPEILEESVYSASNTDYVVFSPCENPEGTIYKDDMKGIKHLKLIELVQNYWVREGTNRDLGYKYDTEHNVSNTVIVDNKEEIIDYIFEHQDNFTAVSFLGEYGDKDYNQAPFTSVLNTQELVDAYGDAAIFASGLIVDGLHYFGGDLWKALDHVLDRNIPIDGTRDQVLLRKDWIRRAKKFSRNYFKNNIKNTVYCMKDVHLWHKWNVIQKNFKPVDFTEILTKPNYIDANTLGALACSGGQCEI